LGSSNEGSAPRLGPVDVRVNLGGGGTFGASVVRAERVAEVIELRADTLLELVRGTRLDSRVLRVVDSDNLDVAFELLVSLLSFSEGSSAIVAGRTDDEVDCFGATLVKGLD
jgi:hypothetical protein